MADAKQREHQSQPYESHPPTREYNLPTTVHPQKTYPEAPPSEFSYNSTDFTPTNNMISTHAYGGGAGYQYSGNGQSGDDYVAPIIDPSDTEVKGFDFTDKSIRRGFIRKMYSILMVQLSVTLGFIAWFVYDKRTSHWVMINIPYAALIALGVVIASVIALACCGDVRRKTPMNYILLSLFTLAESFLLAVISAQFEVVEVLIAVGITAAICLSLTLFAFQTKYDFTMCGGILLVSLVILLIFGIVSAVVPSKVLSMVYASLGALLFSFYLIFDTQLMLGGNHKYSISPEEYVFAALNIYVDIFNIFLHIMMLFGACSR